MNREHIRILLVEDEETDCITVERLFKKEQLPYDLVIARTLAEAVARLDEGGLDLVLIDHKLPDGSGQRLGRRSWLTSGFPRIRSGSGIGTRPRSFPGCTHGPSRSRAKAEARWRSCSSRLLKDPGPSQVWRFRPSSRRETAAVVPLQVGFATQRSGERSAHGDGRGSSAG